MVPFYSGTHATDGGFLPGDRQVNPDTGSAIQNRLLELETGQDRMPPREIAIVLVGAILGGLFVVFAVKIIRALMARGATDSQLVIVALAVIIAALVGAALVMRYLAPTG